MHSTEQNSTFSPFRRSRNIFLSKNRQAGKQITTTEKVVKQLYRYGVRAESTTHTTSEGSQFTSVLYKGDADKGIAILFHGLNSSSLDMLDRALMLHKQSYGFLLVDFPKYFDRVYPYYTFGQNEADVVDDCYCYIRQIFPGRSVYFFGASMGAVAILMSKKKTYVDALVLESPYSSLNKVVENGMTHHFGLAEKFLTPCFLHYLRLFHDVTDIQPEAQISTLKTPMFLISGEIDPYMCLSDTVQLHSKARGYKIFWIVPDAGHEDFYKIHPMEFTQRVLDFLEPTSTS